MVSSSTGRWPVAHRIFFKPHLSGESKPPSRGQGSSGRQRHLLLASRMQERERASVQACQSRSRGGSRISHPVLASRAIRLQYVIESAVFAGESPTTQALMLSLIWRSARGPACPSVLAATDYAGDWALQQLPMSRGGTDGRWLAAKRDLFDYRPVDFLDEIVAKLLAQPGAALLVLAKKSTPELACRSKRPGIPCLACRTSL